MDSNYRPFKSYRKEYTLTGVQKQLDDALIYTKRANMRGLLTGADYIFEVDSHSRSVNPRYQVQPGNEN